MAGLNTHALVLESLKGKAGKVADFGAGEGALSIQLARLGFDVYALDRVANGFQAGGLSNVHFQIADLNTRLPYDNEEFDLACAIEIVEHLENPRHFFRECRRVLKTGGLMILSTPNVISLVSRLSFLLRGSLIYFSQDQYSSNGHITPLRLQDVQNICREVGFRIVRVDFNVGKVFIPKIRHLLPLVSRPFRNLSLGESLMVWAAKD